MVDLARVVNEGWVIGYLLVAAVLSSTVASGLYQSSGSTTA